VIGSNHETCFRQQQHQQCQRQDLQQQCQRPDHQQEHPQEKTSDENKSENEKNQLEVEKLLKEWITRMNNRSEEFPIYRENEFSSKTHWIHSCFDGYFGITSILLILLKI